MKKILMLLILFISFITISRLVEKEDTEKRKNGKIYLKGEKIPFTGKVVAYHQNGTVQSEEDVIKGIQNGELKLYYENGNILKEAFLKKGRHLSYKFYAQNGDLTNVSEYQNGVWWNRDYKDNILIEERRMDLKETGFVIEFYDTGTISSETHFRKGKKHGVYKIYHKNGKIKLDVRYRNGKSIGITKEYYDTGELRSTYDEKTQVEISYWENGNVASMLTYSFKKDAPFIPYTGPKIEYYRNGAIKSRENYRDGIRHGRFIRYYENGRLAFLVNYVNGNRDGFERRYHENGEIREELFWKNGKRHGNRRRLDPNGKEILREKWTNGVVSNNYGRDIRKTYSYPKGETILQESEWKNGKKIRVF
jgi:antitoxin component YwqK of YwqJK toxin-antitoxin module